jgi:1,5-anhydro-D-fructose reductase (1,5-anhydro-D-mannitol-forming)
MAETKLIRVGLIGPGSIADERLIPALAKLPGAVFWSVLGRELGKAEAFAVKHGAKAAQAAFSDLGAFLADPELDAVIIASPDKLHAEQAIAAAKAGKHVFVEKPLATSAKDARRIVSACKKAKVKLTVGYHLRYHAGHRKVALLVADAVTSPIGVIRHINVSWTMQAKTADWRADGKLGQWWSLAALGTHSLDLVSWLLNNDKVKSSSCEISSPVFGSAHDETSLVSLVFESGATAQILSSVILRAPRVVEIFGSKGVIRCVETLGPRGTGTITVNGEELKFEPVDPYFGELQDFVVSVLHGQEPGVTGDAGAANVALLERLTAR